MNLSGFKKLAEDKKTVTMGHPSGHEIKIAKSAISPLQRKQIERLPLHLDEGGDTSADSAENDFVESDKGASIPAANASEDQPDPALSADKFQGAVDQQNAELNSPTGSAGAAIPPPPPDAGGAPAGEVGPRGATATAAGAPGTVSPASVPNLNNAYNLGQKAIKEQADVESKIAAERAKANDEYIAGTKSLEDNANLALKDFTQHRDDFAKYIQANPIDPRHYQENMSTGQKVSTVLGLILGGFSAGFNKTGINPAVTFLNKQIERDLEAQKERVGQQKTILGANEALYHDQVLANNAARVNMNDIYTQKIQLAANQLGTPAAKAAADALSSKLTFDSADRLRQNAIYSATTTAIKNGGAGLSPIHLANAGYMKPEEAIKEQSSIDKQKSAIENLQNLYAKGAVEAQPGRVLSPASSTRLSSINAGIADALLSTDVAHRISPESKKAFLDPYLISTRDALQGTIPSKLNDALAKVKEFSAGQTPITAKYAPGALPKYPSSAPTKVVNGVTYQRGPNGEAIRVK